MNNKMTCRKSIAKSQHRFVLQVIKVSVQWSNKSRKKGRIRQIEERARSNAICFSLRNSWKYDHNKVRLLVETQLKCKVSVLVCIYVHVYKYMYMSTYGRVFNTNLIDFKLWHSLSITIISFLGRSVNLLYKVLAIRYLVSTLLVPCFVFLCIFLCHISGSIPSTMYVQ